MAKTILVVDDSVSIRKILKGSLVQAGFEIAEADNGVNALTALNSQRVDMIITDVNMPEMDGITFTRKARERDDCRATPILILTTEASRQKVEEGQQAGASAWMVKPFQPAKLLETITRVLG